MATHKLLLLPGDGIGPEVMAEVKRLIDWINAQGIAHFETEQGLVGGRPMTQQAEHHRCDHGAGEAADAVIFGAVGGPKWDSAGTAMTRPDECGLEAAAAQPQARRRTTARDCRASR